MTPANFFLPQDACYWWWQGRAAHLAARAVTALTSSSALSPCSLSVSQPWSWKVTLTPRSTRVAPTSPASMQYMVWPAPSTQKVLREDASATLPVHKYCKG